MLSSATWGCTTMPCPVHWRHSSWRNCYRYGVMYYWQHEEKERRTLSWQGTMEAMALQEM
jgi:hypothetical protein